MVLKKWSNFILFFLIYIFQSQEVTLANGDVVKHLLVVDKVSGHSILVFFTVLICATPHLMQDQVLMETIGAVQDLHATMVSKLN